MKKNIPMDKVKEFILAHKKIITFSLGALLLVFSILATYFALNPPYNEESQAKGERKLQELNVTFDKETITQLQQEQAPAVIKGQGGRNPFMTY